MKTFRSLFMFITILSVSLFISCGDDDDDGPGGGGNGKQMLPVKIYNAGGDAKFEKAFKYDDKNRVTEVTNKISVMTPYESVTVENIIITYDNSAEENEAITDIYSKRVINSTLATRPITQEEFYTVSYAPNTIGLRLVKSTNDNHTEGLGTALGIVVLELDDDGKVTERKETWEDGLVAFQKYVYESDNVIEDHRITTFDGKEVITTKLLEYDDKFSIYHAVNAPKWIGELPLADTIYKGKNNANKMTNYNSESGSTYILHTTYEYNQEGYPVKYSNEGAGNMEDSEWIIEYKNVD